MNTKLIAVLAVVIIVVASIGGYLAFSGSDSGEEGETPSTPEVPDDDYYPVTVETYDPALGDYREMTFTERPERIIAYQGGALELLLYFGLEDNIIKAYVKENYVLCYEELEANLEKVDVEPRDNGTVETIVALQPDLIVGWSSTFRDTAQQTMDFWADRNVNCYCANYPNSTVEDVCTAVRNIGIIFNMQDKAQNYIDTMMENVEDIGEVTSKIPEDERPTVLGIEIGYEGTAFCYGAEYITGQLIEYAGGISAYDGGMDKLTYEQIAALRPDVILLIVNSGDFRDESNIQSLINDLKNIPGFASIPAIVNDRIVTYGLYEVYQSGIIPEDIVERLYYDFYPSGIPDEYYYPVTVTTNINGVDVEQTFESAPERVVTYWNANLELMCYFGLEDRVVAAFANEDYEALYDELQADYDSTGPKLNPNGANVEAARSYNPDVIIGWASTFQDSYLGSYENWNSMGTNCIVTNRPSDTVEDYLGILEMIGKIFNMERVAYDKIQEFTASYADIINATYDLTEDEKVTALMIEPGYDSGCFVYGSDFLSGDLITVSGGINLFDGGMEMLTFEQIASYDPDIIFIMSGSGSNPLALEQAIEEFTSNPAFASMTDNIVAFGFYEVYMGGLLPDDIVDRMFEAMYPETN